MVYIVKKSSLDVLEEIDRRIADLEYEIKMCSVEDEWEYIKILQERIWNLERVKAYILGDADEIEII